MRGRSNIPGRHPRRTTNAAAPPRPRTLRDAHPPLVERLEGRQLLSATLTGHFAGAVPANLHPTNKSQLTVRVTNEGDAPARGRVTVSLHASADAVLDEGDARLADVT